MKEHKLGFTEEENLEIFKFFDAVRPSLPPVLPYSRTPHLHVLPLSATRHLPRCDMNSINRPAA